jgi:multimeric flavodoxin WrbA
MMKAIALVASARQYGNCQAFASYMLDRMNARDVQTELVNFYDHRIEPCHNCNYECLQKYDPAVGQNMPCPIEDDVRAIWEKTWDAEILLILVPNYGGMPPALWLSFSQRQQAFFRQAPQEKLKKSVVSALVIAAPHNSSGAQWAPSFMADEIKWMDRKVAGFEVINNAGFETEALFGGLIHEPEIQRRLDFLTDRTLKLANEILLNP